MAEKWTNWKDGRTPMARCNTCGFECVVSNNPDALLTDADACPECETRTASNREQKFVSAEEIARLTELEAKAPGELAYWPTHYAGTTPYIIATDETGRETRLFVARNTKGKTADQELSYSEADRAIAYAKRMTAATNLLPSLLVEREEMQKRIKELEAEVRTLLEVLNRAPLEEGKKE